VDIILSPKDRIHSLIKGVTLAWVKQNTS